MTILRNLIIRIILTSNIDFFSACTFITCNAQSSKSFPRGTFTRSCFKRPTRNSCESSRLGDKPGVRCRSMVTSRCVCSQTMLLEAPKAVQLKYNCLVSNGNKNGHDWFSSSHHVGKLSLDKTNGSWICCQINARLKRPVICLQNTPT